MRAKTLAVVLSLSLGGALGASETTKQDRILVILADDLGVEQLALYRPGAPGLVSRPAIDEIAARGLTFRNAWVNPLCSPTRATIQTGRYACRTGIGAVIEKQCSDHSLPQGGELPRMLTGFQTGAFGKWHLEDQAFPDLLSPRSHGYQPLRGDALGGSRRVRAACHLALRPGSAPRRVHLRRVVQDDHQRGRT